MSDSERGLLNALSKTWTSRSAPGLDGHIDLTDNTSPSQESSEARQDPNIDEEGESLTRTKTSRIPNPGKLRQQLAQRKYAKYTEAKHDKDLEDDPSRGSSKVGGMDELSEDTQEPQEPQSKDMRAKKQGTFRRGQDKVKGVLKYRRRAPGIAEEDTLVQVLYENQRGTWLFGTPYFSSNSLLNFDPAAWTDHDGAPSAVDVTNAQLPDPSWQWAWRRWYVDMSLDVDEQGWQYSFMFQSKFNWHGTHPWFHSFVRRRRWIRKRVRGDKAIAEERNDSSKNTKGAAHTRGMGTDYFSIRAGLAGSQPPSLADAGSIGRSKGGDPDRDDSEELDNLQALLRRLKKTMLDREKINTVIRYIDQSGEDLHYLADEMPHIMSLLVFQHSRRTLLARLLSKLDERTENEKQSDQQSKEKGKQPRAAIDDDSSKADLEQRKTQYLRQTAEAADHELKKMEYWSDLVDIAHEGNSLGTAEAITEPPPPTNTDA